MKRLFQTTLFATVFCFITLTIHAQNTEKNIGYSVILKPKLGMSYEYDQALKNYIQNYRRDSAWAVRVQRISGGPRNGFDLLSVPLKSWEEYDMKKPYQSDSATRAWQNVLKYCDELIANYYTYDAKNSDPLEKIKPETKYMSMTWILDPKADEEMFAKEFKKIGPLLKKGGYKFSITQTITGNTRYSIIMALENGFKEFNIQKPEYKELFTKEYPEKDAYKTHMNILQKSTGDFFTEFRTIRTAFSTR